MTPDRGSLNHRRRLAGLAVVCALAGVTSAADAFAEFALLRPVKDSTLVEDPAGALANGSGPTLFAGRVNASSRSIRRALLAFDVAAAVPAGSTVTAARLWLNLSSTSAGPVPVRLYRVAADWGEAAAASSGGGGAPATPGDATWLHRFYSDVFWAQPGGDFDPLARAEAVVDQPGSYTWGSTAEMVGDVQAWLDQPGSAFGWILLGDEGRPQTVKRFDSRELPEAANQPLLEVDFVPPCAPDPAGPGYWRRQCEGLDGCEPVSFRLRRGDAAWGTVAGAGAAEATNFSDRVVPCARRYLADLGLPDLVACAAVLSDPPHGCTERAELKLAVLVLNVCAARLQTSCPVDAGEDGCSATSVGDLLLEISDLMRAGDCRAASGCGGSADKAAPVASADVAVNAK